MFHVAASSRGSVRVSAASVSSEAEPPRGDMATGDVSESVKGEYARRRALTFAGIVVGYATYYFTRLSFTYVSPLLLQDASLGLDMTSLGAITTVFPVFYAFSKFAGGVLGDATDARTIHALGLLITGTINIGFGCGSSLSWFAMCWALNGLFQGFGAPPCAKILANWFPTTTRGTWWSMWNASHNIGGFLIPLVAAGAATAFGWRWGMIVPGAIGIAVGLLVYTLIRDDPKLLGLPSAHTVAGIPEPAQSKKEAEKEASGKASGARAALGEVLSRPAMWVLAATYFVIYAIRQGIVNWSHFYLLEERGVATAAEAAARVSGLELGGLLGNLTAGPLSDWLVRRAPKGAGAVGKRNVVVLFYLLMTAVCILMFWQSPTGGFFASSAGHWLLLFGVGHFIYGPQLLVAMSAAEIVPKRAIATSQGFVGFVSYMGAACSGLPLSQIVQTPGGWDKYFMVLIGMCVVSAAMMLPMLGQKNYQQAVAAEGDLDGADDRKAA